MKDRRLLRNCLMLALPTAALVVFGVWFLSSNVTQIVANEHARVEFEARRVVDEMKRGEREPSFVWEYGAGVVKGGEDWARRFPPQMKWKDWESLSLRKGSSMWGLKRRRGSDAAVVWVRDGRFIHAALADLPETDFAVLFWLFGPLVLLLLIATTAVAIASVHSYAKSRDDFIAAAVHDLTTPLVGLRRLIGVDDEESKRLNERMLRMVGNMRDFMSLGGRRRKPVCEEFAIGDAFDEAYSVFALDYEDETSGPVETGGDKSLRVFADETLVTQILWNLLGNDLKYAAPHGKVRVEFASEGRFAHVRFIDEGPGLSKRQMRRVFNRYWRAKTVLVSGKGGFGIGLCTSREFAREMGGDLTVGPNGAKGCVFDLALPLAFGPTSNPQGL